MQIKTQNFKRNFKKQQFINQTTFTKIPERNNKDHPNFFCSSYYVTMLRISPASKNPFHLFHHPLKSNFHFKI